MYLYFTADNSEAETECKVTRSGKYEKVIAGYKKSSPDINWLSNSLYFIYKLQFDFNVVIEVHVISFAIREKSQKKNT